MTEGKPKPMIFQQAASRFVSVPEPSACLVFEDAPTGVAAGKAADMCVRCATPIVVERLQILGLSLLCWDGDGELGS